MMEDKTKDVLEKVCGIVDLFVYETVQKDFTIPIQPIETLEERSRENDRHIAELQKQANDLKATITAWAVAYDRQKAAE